MILLRKLPSTSSTKKVHVRVEEETDDAVGGEVDGGGQGRQRLQLSILGVVVRVEEGDESEENHGRHEEEANGEELDGQVDLLLPTASIGRLHRARHPAIAGADGAENGS